jgi:hypothetical protein
MKRIQVWLDCDGVLADFDEGFRKLTGTDPQLYEELYGTSAFWSRIAKANSFFENLPVMAEGKALYNSIAHLRPIILTGTPNGDWSITQKLRWRDKHYPGVPMVTCRSKDKRIYCQPGDVLIDDLLKYESLWKDSGGQFMHYTQNANQIVTNLNNYLQSQH